MAVRKEKIDQLEERMHSLGIQKEDLKEKFIIGSGKGGQKLQKTASCVFLQHIPTGIEIKCQKERAREVNRYHARVELCEQLEQLLLQKKTKKQVLEEKIRKQKKRRKKRNRQKISES